MNAHARQTLANVTDPVDRARYQLVHESKDGHECGAEQIADLLDKAPGTVRNKANPFFAGDDFTVDQIVDAMNFKGDYRLLDAIAGKCSRVVVELEKFGATGDVGVLEQFLQVEMAMGEFAADVHEAVQAGELDEAEVQKCTDAGTRIAEKVEGMLARLKAMKRMEKRK